jgi:hypothetical protein
MASVQAALEKMCLSLWVVSIGASGAIIEGKWKLGPPLGKCIGAVLWNVSLEHVTALPGAACLQLLDTVPDVGAYLPPPWVLHVAGAPKPSKSQEMQVGDPRRHIVSGPVATFSIQALQGVPYGEATKELLAAARSCGGRVRLDEEEALTSPWLVDAEGVRFTPCRTQGSNAACGMHAVFGAPEAGAFAHRSPRSFARTLLGPSLAALREKLPEGALRNLQEVTTSLWAEFLVPFIHQRAHGEAGCFGRALQRIRPDLFQEMRAMVLAAQHQDVAFLRAKDAVQVAARALFQQDAEDRFLQITSWAPPQLA